jgi:hypothetical protein
VPSSLDLCKKTKNKNLSLLWDSNSAVALDKCSNSDHLATELGIHDTTHVE